MTNWNYIKSVSHCCKIKGFRDFYSVIAFTVQSDKICVTSNTKKLKNYANFSMVALSSEIVDVVDFPLSLGTPFKASVRLALISIKSRISS